MLKIPKQDLKIDNSIATLFYCNKFFGTHAGIEYLLKFAVNWMGTNNNSWENSSNWGCIYLTDANTDVFITPGMSLYPVVSSNTAIRSLTIQNGATVIINNGVQVIVLQ